MPTAIPALPELPPPFDALRDHVLAHSVKRGEFTLKSGARSSWFLDTKQTACRPDGIVLVADAALSVIPEEATAIGGLTMGADPVAFGVAAVAATRARACAASACARRPRTMASPGALAGALQPGDRVVVTEDTVTRGTSLMEAVEVVRAFGAEPVLITVIVDRGGTSAALAEAAGIPYRPLLTAPDLGFDVRHLTRPATDRVFACPRSAGTRRTLGQNGWPSGASRTPGLRIPGSSARLIAAAAASSAGLRTRCSQRVLATPTPCSAEIVPPSAVAAPSTSAVIAAGVAGVEHVDVDVALGEVTERHQPPAVAADDGPRPPPSARPARRPARRRPASAAHRGR